ncbi:serpin family protein [Serinibacter arcticus]|uniref:Serpin family protein n=2 Tax=Serinibacter arcticus TaxID=1655435 RepID=A0A2U1ZZA0_9MICO|nr:serpin family protein [Serinibacter arcticus]
MKQTRRHGIVRAAAGAGVLALAACSTQGAASTTTELRSDVAHEVVAIDEAPALAGVLAANDALGLSMLRAATDADPDANAVVSPFSALVALSMLAEGARGTTATAFDTALGASGEDRTRTVSALQTLLGEHDGDPASATADELPEAPLLHLADRIVLDEGFDVEPAYLDALARWYGAGVETTDLGDPAAREVLGSWLAEHTGGLIRESAIEPNELLRVVLQDVVLFAGRWQVPFSAGATAERPFTGPHGPVQVETMAGSAYGRWTVVEDEGWTAVRLPYTEGFHADLVLPPDGVDPAGADPALLALLAEVPAAPVGDPTTGSIAVTVPVLDLTPEPLDLVPDLTEVGLGELLGTPDLSGIANDLTVGQAMQQARLIVDEDGTVAAAVTEIGGEETSAPVHDRTVQFDRPFLLRLAHSESGLTLFLAAVRDPAVG